MASANGNKETPHLSVSTQSKKAEIGIQTLLGDYVERGTNHGKKYYQKVQKIEGHEDIKVFLYYWDQRDGADFSGWWFGDQLGGSQVWARSPSHTPTPPRVGWKIPWDAAKAELGVLFVDPYKAQPVLPGGKMQNQVVPPPGKAGGAPVAPAAAAAAGAGISPAGGPVTSAAAQARVQKATEQVEAAEAAATEALTNAKELMTGECAEDTLTQVQELLQKQLTMLMELPKSLMQDINEVKKGGWAVNSSVSELSKLIPKARALQANMTSEITKLKGQVQKAALNAQTAKKQAELQEQKRQAEERDGKELSEALPAVIELVTLAEDSVDSVHAMAEPLIAEPLDDDGDTLKKAMDEIETSAGDAQNKIIEARKQTNIKLQGARKFAAETQKKALAEYSALQTKLTEAQKKLNPYKTFRKEYKSRVEAKKALVEITEKIDAAELEVEKASLMSSAAEQGQMSEDEVASAEKMVTPAHTAITAALRTLELKIKAAMTDNVLKDELNKLKEQGLAAKKKLEGVTTVLRKQKEGIAMQQMVAMAIERSEQVEAVLQKCGEAEMPFLKGIEVLPQEESTKAISECEAAGGAAEKVVTGAKAFIRQKVAEASKSTQKESAKSTIEELNLLMQRCEEAAKKLATFKAETLERKMGALLADLMEAITGAEAKSQVMVKASQVFLSETLEEVSTEELQEAVEKSAVAEKEATSACLEARKLIAAKQKESKGGELAVAIAKLQGRINQAQSEVAKGKKASESGTKLIKGKTVLLEEEERIKQAEADVERVEKTASGCAEGEELSDEAIQEMGSAVVSSQKSLKASVSCIQAHLPGAVPAVKAGLQKLVERSKKAQEKLNSVLAATKDQRERVLSEAYVKEGLKKVEEVETALEKVNKAELPFLKGLEFLPIKEATDTIAESEAAATAMQEAISEARTYIASKNLEVKQFKEAASKPAVEEFGKQSERINSSAAKLSQFKKDTEARKKTAQMQEASEKIGTVEEDVKKMAEAVEPFSKGEVDEMSVDDAFELCQKLLVQFKEIYTRMDEARVFIAGRQKDVKGSVVQTEQLQKLQSRLSDARVEIAKTKMVVSEREQKIVSKKLLSEASDMVARLEEDVQKATESCAPLLEHNGEEFLVAGSVQLLASALRDYFGEHDTDADKYFEQQLGGAADGKITQETFVEHLEKLPEMLKKEELTFTSERRVAVFNHIDADKDGFVSLSEFKDIFALRYTCVRGISVTDSFEINSSKTVAKVEPDEVLEAMGNPKIESTTDMTRVEVRVVASGKTGFATMLGNAGTVYLKPVSPFNTFCTEMDKKIDETVKSAMQVSVFFKTKSTELSTAGKQGALSEARAELVKLRLKVTTATTSLEQLKKKAVTSKKDWAKREQADKDAHKEIHDKKLADVVLADITTKTQAMEAVAKQLDEACAPLVSIKGSDLDSFATPAAVLEEAQKLSLATTQSIAEARAFREEQLTKVGKAVKGPLTEVKRELQKMEMKAAALAKKNSSTMDSVRNQCQAIVEARYGETSAALREEVRRRDLTNEALFSELLEPGEDRISEAAFCKHLESLEGLNLKPEVALLLCRHIEVGGVGKRKFCSFLQQYFVVTKSIAITNDFDVGKAKILRTADIDEVIEVLEGPSSDEKLGLTRIKGRSMTDAVEGWISVRGNQGTTFLQKVVKPYYMVTKDSQLEKEFKNEGQEAIRTLKADEVLELVEGPRKETFTPATRVRGKACSDGATGWFTVKDKNGTAFTEPDGKYYSCTTSVAMTDEEDIKNCNVIRKLDKGEMFIVLEGPNEDKSAGILRVKGKTLKDDKIGWVTIKGNAGTIYADQSSKHYTVLQEVPMQKKMDSLTAETVRMLAVGEALQALEAPKEETFPPEVRMKGRALSDDAVGWITKKDNVRPWSPYYKCIVATPIHSTVAVEEAEVVRQLDAGETAELVEGPMEEGKTLRMKARAEKDGAIGWVTIRDASGKQLLES